LDHQGNGVGFRRHCRPGASIKNLALDVIDMPKANEVRLEKKIERSYEQKGFSQPRAEHIARAVVYGRNGSHPLQHKRR
jgi:hypothetical protein